MRRRENGRKLVFTAFDSQYNTVFGGDDQLIVYSNVNDSEDGYRHSFKVGIQPVAVEWQFLPEIDSER